MTLRHASLILLATTGLLGGCAVQEPTTAPALKAVSFDALDGWQQEKPAALLMPLRAECRRIGHLPADTVLGGVVGTIPNGQKAGDWSGACDAVKAVAADDSAARAYFQTWFVPYEVETAAKYTGYYEAEVTGSRTKTAAFQTPLYGRPADLVQAKATNGQMVSGHWVEGAFKPYFSRAEINGGAIDGKAPVIAWLKSPQDLFFLQIQGSGRIVLGGGGTVRVTYDGRNGQPYVPIGRVLVERGALAAGTVTMQSIRAWLDSHPDQAADVMNSNPNYVFFRELTGLPQTAGAPGALGVALTPGRSVAIDRHLLPLGVPLWVETTMPQASADQDDTPDGAWTHLVLAQDVGADIRGAGRADIFTGWGPQAESVAGRLNAPGKMIVLLPRPPA